MVGYNLTYVDGSLELKQNPLPKRNDGHVVFELSEEYTEEQYIQHISDLVGKKPTVRTATNALWENLSSLDLARLYNNFPLAE